MEKLEVIGGGNGLGFDPFEEANGRDVIYLQHGLVTENAGLPKNPVLRLSKKTFLVAALLETTVDFRKKRES